MSYECWGCGEELMIEGVVIKNFDPEQLYCEECGAEPLTEEEIAQKAEEKRTRTIEWLKFVNEHFSTEEMENILASPAYRDKNITLADLA